MTRIWWRKLFGRSRAERELDDEVRAYLDLLTEEKIAAGMRPEDARRAARIELGGIEQVKEACRDVRPARLLDELWQDARYGLRTLGRNPAFTSFAVLTLALGIGAATTIFSVFYAVLLRPLPFRDPDRIVSILEGHKLRPTRTIGVSRAELDQWRTHSRVLEDLTASSSVNVTLSVDGVTERLPAQWVLANFFDFIGRRAIVGRTFLPEDERPAAPCVVMLGYGLWTRRFGADRGVIGKQVVANGRPCAIAGVASPGTRNAAYPWGLAGENDLWMLITMDPNNKAHGLQVWARLKPGIDLRRAAEELGALTLSDPIHSSDTQGLQIKPMSEYVAGNMRPQLLLLLGAVGFVLLLGCANVANLLLVRTASRKREIAVRRALGAGRRRLLRQLLTESLLLGLLGGVLGSLLAVWGVKAVVAVAPATVPRLEEVRIDLWVLGFSLAVSILAAILSGLAPFEGSRTGLNETLQESARGLSGARSQRLSGLLVAAEVGLALVLLIGASLTIHSFVRLLGDGPGLRTKDVLAFQVSLPASKYLELVAVYPGQREGARKMRERPRLAAVRHQLLSSIRSLPGVEAAAATDFVPLSCIGMGWDFMVEGRSLQPGEILLANLQPVTPDYFQLLAIPIVRGRAFTERDHENSPPVIVIDETLAARYFPGEDPVGRRLLLADYDQWRSNELWGGVPAYRRPHEVIGVVRTVKHCGFDRAEADPMMYVPWEPGCRSALPPRWRRGVWWRPCSTA